MHSAWTCFSRSIWKVTDVHSNKIKTGRMFLWKTLFFSRLMLCLLKHDTKQNTYSHATKARETIELCVSFTHFSRTHYSVCITSKTYRRPKTCFKFPHLFLLRLCAMHLYWFFLFLTFNEKFLTCHHESSKKWSMTYFQNLMSSFIKPRKYECERLWSISKK